MSKKYLFKFLFEGKTFMNTMQKNRRNFIIFFIKEFKYNIYIYILAEYYFKLIYMYNIN